MNTPAPRVPCRFLEFPRRGRLVWWGLVLGLLVGQALALVLLAVRTFPGHAVDFAQHYFLGYWVNTGGSITNAQWPEYIPVRWAWWMPTIIPYLPYQPLVLPFMRLLARFSFPHALILWLLGAGWLWWYTTGVLAPTLHLSPRCVRMAAFFFPPLWFAFFLGNVDIYLTALLALALAFQHQGHWGRSGYVWGWLVSFKPFLLLASLPGWRRKPRFFLTGMLAGGLSALLWAWVAVGSQGLRFFLHHLPFYTQQVHASLWFINASLWGWMAAIKTLSLFPQHLPSMRHGWLVAGFIFGITLMLWHQYQSRISLWWAQGLWLSLAVLLSPFSWTHYALYLWVSLLYLISQNLISQRDTKSTPWHYGIAVLLLPIMAVFLLGYVFILVTPTPLPALVMGSTYLGLWGIFLAGLGRFPSAGST